MIPEVEKLAVKKLLMAAEVHMIMGMQETLEVKEMNQVKGGRSSR